MNFSKENWNLSEYENWLDLNVHIIENVISDEEIIRALINGVPSSFAPFSSFNSIQNYISLQSLNDYYDEILKDGTEYIVFGTDGSGNPFCINKLNENKIVLLDFDSEKIISTNENIKEFLDSIFVYKQFVDLIQEKYGEDALFDNLYHSDDIEYLKSKFLEINPNLLFDSEFWMNEIELLIINKG